MRWFDDYANVKAMGRWFVDTHDFTAQELQGYYDSPYKWSDEWEQYNGGHRGELGEVTDDCPCSWCVLKRQIAAERQFEDWTNANAGGA